MTYVRRCNVLIASPADVAAERDAVFRAIATWNGGIGDADRQTVFVPLMWESHAVPDADKPPQAAIDDQLLDRSDRILAFFSSRLGTPTRDYPAGTVEELSKRTGKAAVFFRRAPTINLEADDCTQQLEQLKAFKGRLSSAGFCREYDDVPDLVRRIRDQLDAWSAELERDCGTPLIAREAPWTIDAFVREMGAKGEPVCLLLYNVELFTFRSPEIFAERRKLLAGFPCIKRVIFLLPQYKIERLRGFLPKLVAEGDDSGLANLYVCPQKQAADGNAPRVTSSLAFLTACEGDDPVSGVFVDHAEMGMLVEPFASAVDFQEGGRDLQWDHRFYLQARDATILDRLRQIWREHFDDQGLVEMRSLLTRHDDEVQVDSRLNDLRNAAPVLDHEDAYKLITELRTKLFDPNVPSYLLGDQYELLDWNPAFELVFPTTKFYRKMSVKEFVDCLDNSADVKRHGLELAENSVNGTPFDIEKLVYTSPIFGKMTFTKIASRVSDPFTQKTLGWIIALNVSNVEHWQIFEDALRRTNEEQSLITLYAPAADRILGQFPGYQALVQAHVGSVRASPTILDLGSGPGYLAAALLQAGLAVTSVDMNDAMIEIARKRCAGLPKFLAVKANVETLHAPEQFYDASKLGMAYPYHAACMLNLYQWLLDPVSLLRRMREQELLIRGGLLTISLMSGTGEVEEQMKALNYFRMHSSGSSGTFWTSDEYDRYAQVMRQFLDRKVAGRYAEADVEAHLKAAGYEIVQHTRVGYRIGDKTFAGVPFFVARATPG